MKTFRREELFAGKYEKLTKIGEGGHGEVYRAYEPKLDRVVAIKMLQTDDEDLGIPKVRIESLKDEAQKQASLRSEHTVRVFEFDYEPNFDRHYIAMEFVEGRRLDEIAAEGPMDPARLMTILIGVCKSIAEAHKKRVIHRDIKPLNIIISNDPDQPDHARVIDFGIAKRFSDEVTGRTERKAVVIEGTKMYLAPEVRDGHPATERSDIYAIGLVALQCLAGTKTVPVEYLNHRGELVVEGDFDLGELIPSNRLIPGWELAQSNQARLFLVSILEKMLKKSPDERYDSVDKIIRKLQLPLFDALSPKNKTRRETEMRLPAVNVSPSDLAVTPEAESVPIITEDEVKTVDGLYQLETGDSLVRSSSGSDLKLDSSNERIVAPSNRGNKTTWMVVFGLLGLMAASMLWFVTQVPSSQETIVKETSPPKTARKIDEKPAEGLNGKAVHDSTVAGVRVFAAAQALALSMRTKLPRVSTPKVMRSRTTLTNNQKPQRPVQEVDGQTKTDFRKREPDIEKERRSDELSIDDYAPPGMYDL